MTQRSQPLVNLAHVRAGWSGTPSDAERGDSDAIRWLVPADVAEDGTVVWAALRRVAPMPKADQHQARPGDVLVALRSARHLVIVIPALTEPVAVGSNWALVRPEPGVNGEYLAWHLRHPDTRRELAKSAKGSNIQFLPASAIADLKVPLPPESVQSTIVRADALARALERCEQKLASARRTYIDAFTLHQAIAATSTDHSTRD